MRRPDLMLTALGAMLTCLADPGGLLARRARLLIGFGLAGAVILGGFGLLRGLSPLIELPLAALGLFALSFVRVYGLAFQALGNLLSVVLILALDAPLPGLAAAFSFAGYFLAGGVWALVLTLVIWPVHPYAPVREALGSVWQELAALAHDLGRICNAPPGAAWEDHARVHRRAVRTAIETARPLVTDAIAARGRSGGRAGQSLIRLEAGEQAFGALIGLSELLEEADPSARRAARRLLAWSGAMCATIARAIRADHPLAPEKVRRMAAAVEAGISAGDTGLPIAPFARTIAERIVLASTVSAPTELAPGAAIGAAPSAGWRARLIGPLSANLHFSSAAFRHALRVGVVATPALAATGAWTGPLGHWITIALLLTMQPYFALTWVRAFERIGGTVLGGLLAAAVATFAQSPFAVAAALFPLSVIAFTLRRVSYGMFMAALTPMIVLLVDVAMPGSSELTIALDRAIYTLIGGSLAVAGTLILWPSFEPARLRQELASAVLAHGRYGTAVLSLMIGQPKDTNVEAARRAAGLASNNLEASLQRTLNEPTRRRQARFGVALLADATLRRIAGRLVAMQQDPALPALLPTAQWIRWRDWLAQAMQSAAAGQAPPPRPTLPAEAAEHRAGQALLRIAGQVELLSNALAGGSG
ncbi:MAG: FUSC family protein [Acetobacteraceae bacterium]